MTPTECAQDLSTPLAPLDATPPGDRVLYCLAFGAALSILFSIAVSQILMGLGMIALICLRRPLRFPPIALPLLLFLGATVIAVFLSGDPWTGAVQLRKFFVFGILLLIFNTFRTTRQIQHLVLAWSAGAALSGLVALGQAFTRWREAIQLGASPYDYVLDGRITGFQSHWMTFGGAQMIVLLMLLAFLLFSDASRWKPFGWACAFVIWVTIVLNLTRSIFLIGVPVGAAVLAWNYKRWLLLAIPAAALVLVPATPIPVRERVFSVFRPHGEVDSNTRRVVMARTGWRMIEAHPWFGIGPEQVGPQFDSYLPPDVLRPLPKGWYGHLHNLYLQYAAERGLAALACVLWMIARIARHFRRALQTAEAGPDRRFVWVGALAVIAAVLAEGFFEYNLGDSEVLTLFLAVVACGFVAIASLKPSVPLGSTLH